MNYKNMNSAALDGQVLPIEHKTRAKQQMQVVDCMTPSDPTKEKPT